MPKLRIGNRTVDAKAILFDKDGTLVEFHELWVGTTKSRLDELSKQLEKRQKPPLGSDEARDLSALLGVPGAHLGIDRGHVDSYGPLIMSGPADHETLAAGFIYQRRNEPFDECLRLTQEAFKAALAQQRPRLLPGAAEVLTRLRATGWLLGLVTNDGVPQTQDVLTQLGLLETFHSVVCAHYQEVDGIRRPIRKPDAEMVLRFCRDVEINASDAILIADSHNDLKMAPAAHCAAAIGVLSGVDTEEQLMKASPDTILDSVADLQD